MLSAVMPRRLAVAAVLAVAAFAASCGEEGIQLSKDDPDYEGAKIFQQHCSGCHTLAAAGTEGSAVKANSREYKDGPNFDQRKETTGPGPLRDRERRVLVRADAAGHRRRGGRREGGRLRGEVLRHPKR